MMKLQGWVEVGGDECYCKATCKAEKKGLKDGTSALKYVRRW